MNQLIRGQPPLALTDEVDLQYFIFACYFSHFHASAEEFAGVAVEIFLWQRHFDKIEHGLDRCFSVTPVLRVDRAPAFRTEYL